MHLERELNYYIAIDYGQYEEYNKDSNSLPFKPDTDDLCFLTGSWYPDYANYVNIYLNFLTNVFSDQNFNMIYIELIILKDNNSFRMMVSKPKDQRKVSEMDYYHSQEQQLSGEETTERERKEQQIRKMEEERRKMEEERRKMEEERRKTEEERRKEKEVQYLVKKCDKGDRAIVGNIDCDVDYNKPALYKLGNHSITYKGIGKLNMAFLSKKAIDPKEAIEAKSKFEKAGSTETITTPWAEMTYKDNVFEFKLLENQRLLSDSGFSLNNPYLVI